MSDEWLVRAPEPESALLDELRPQELEARPTLAAPAPPVSGSREDRVEATEGSLPGAEEYQSSTLTSEDLSAPCAEASDSSEQVQLASSSPEPEEAVEAPVPEPQLAPSPAGPRCPYCRESLREVVEGHQDEERAAERTVACAECQTPVHARCVQIHGGCVTSGCSGRSFAFVDRVPRPQIRAARIARPRPRRRARPPREPRQVPECPRDWVRRDAPLLILGLVGILSLALFGDSLAEGARHFGELHAAVTRK